MSWVAIFLESTFILPENNEEQNLIINFKDIIFKMIIPDMIKKYGYNPNEVQTNENVLREFIDLIFEMISHATFEIITEEKSMYKITFNLINGGKLIFKTIRNLPITHCNQTYFQKIDPYKIYSHEVQPDPTLLPILIEYYLKDIMGNFNDYFERNKE
jgi:hypothetical protein